MTELPTAKAERGPRSSLALLKGPADPDWVRWLDAAGVNRETAGERPLIVWELISTNRRRLAWSARSFPTTSEAHAHARRTIERAGELDVDRFARGTQQRWRLLLDSETLAIGRRGYITVRDREHSLEVAVTALRRGVDEILLPPPFDTATGRWSPGFSVREWMVQAQLELADRDYDRGPTRERPASLRQYSAIRQNPGPVGRP